MLKLISRAHHSNEILISKYFSAEPLSSHPRNHCIPLYEVLDVFDDPDACILVLPFLREYKDPRFKSIGEAAEFFRQVFEGLQFIHQCNVAHRDCMNLNIMMDPKPTYPDSFHPRLPHLNRNFKGHAKHFTRTARPTKYYFIDFGLSQKYNPEDGPPLEEPVLGGDRTVPEFKNWTRPLDPFPTDIYYLGNMIREDFLQKTRGVEFIKPLVDDMVQDDPSKRPTIDQVVERYKTILRELSSRKLRSRLVELSEPKYRRRSTSRDIHHFLRTLVHVLLFKSALPTP